MFEANILPGQGFAEFTVWEKQGRLSDTGRAGSGIYEPTGKQLLGILTNATQKEIEQWKQNGHPITHKITSYGVIETAEAENYLVLADGRQFYVQGSKNPGNLNITMLYYVEERRDLKIGGGLGGK